MIRSILKKTVISAILSIIIFSCNSWGQKSDANDSNALPTAATQLKADELLKMVPSESLFVLRINKLENTLDKVDQFLSGVSPMPMATRMMVQMQIAKVLGSPQLSGLNMSGDFVVFGIALEDQNVAPALLVPVTDYQNFISDNNNIGKPDAKGISKIKLSEVVSVASMKVGNYALITDKAENLQKIVEAAKTGFDTVLDAGQIGESASMPIWACGNIEKVNKVFSGKVDAEFEMMKSMMKQCPQGGMNPEAIMNLYFDSIKKLMSQTKLVTINVNPKADVLNITDTIVAVPGTEMAAALAAHSAAKVKAPFGYLKNGALINSVFRLDTPLIKKGNEAVLDMLIGLGSDKMTEENKTKWKQLLTDSTSNIGATFAACSAVVDSKNKPPFVCEYVVQIKDTKKFAGMIDQAIELTNSSGLFDFYKQMGMQVDLSIKHNVDTYNGIAIDSVKLGFKVADANSPQAQILSQMYGHGFDYRIAMVDNLCVYAINSDPNAIHKLIDEVKAGGTKQPASEVQSALAIIPGAEKADMFGTVNVLRYFEMVKNMVPSLPMMPQITIPQSSSNIAFAARAENGKVIFDAAIPKQHLSEIVTMAMTIQQQVMGQMQMMQPGQQPMQEQMEQPEPKKIEPEPFKQEEKKP